MTQGKRTGSFSTRFACLLAVVCTSLAPTLTAQSAVLFVSTDPLNATLELDGTTYVQQQTPLLLRSLDPGVHQATLRKPGYHPERLEIDIEEGQVRVVHVDLVDELWGPGISSKDIPLSFRGRQFGPEQPLVLAPGEYSIQINAERVMVEPQFPEQKTLNTLKAALPVFALAAGLLTANDLAHPRGSVPSFSPATISMYIATAGTAGLGVALGGAKKRYAARKQDEVAALSPVPDEAQDLYRQAQQLLAEDRLEEALAAFSRVVTRYGDSLYVPLALYKTAAIHLLMGEDRWAEKELALIAARYPLAEVYDKTLWSLSTLYFAQGRYQESLDSLNSMIGLDPQFSEEEILQARARIAAAREETTAQHVFQGDMQ